MALPTVDPVSTRLSFAKIAAMPAPSIQPALPNTHKDNKNKASPVTQVKALSTVVKSQDELQHETITTAGIGVMQNTMNQMVVAENGSSADLSLRNGTNAEAFDDQQSNISTSSLKQQSFDTKSIASVTTFGMDEKESIRPDDSASVRAGEDDDSNPGVSRHSSFQHDTEPLAPGLRGSSKLITPGVSTVARRYPGLVLTNPPRFGDLPISPVSDTRAEEIEKPDSNVLMPKGDNATIPSPSLSPDEKLIEALASPKDRLPLLQLEQRILTFITYGRDNILELPPQNSFTRLLTHKLADYYSLHHQVTEDNSSVRIFRTAPSPLPLSLADIAKSIHAGPQSISTAAQVKIMRRVQLGRQISAGNSTAASSSVPSKATSENGGDVNSEEGLQSPCESTPGREKLKSREEREAQYKLVRDRIFGDFQESITSESGSTGETSASMSRSSSTSGGKKKSRKSKTPKDDTFTRRSEFFAYGPMHMQQNMPSVYSDPGYQDPYQPHQQPSYPPQNYGQQQMQQYPHYDHTLSYGNGGGYPNGSNQMFTGNDGWNQMTHPAPASVYGIQPMQSMQPFMHQAQMSTPSKDQYPQPIQAVPPPTGWTQSQFPNAFQQAPTMNNNSAQWLNYNTALGSPAPEHQFGSIPRHAYANDASYNNTQPVLTPYDGGRSLFNPQTRSFVPNNTTGRGGNRQGRKKGGQPDNVMKKKDATAFYTSLPNPQSDNNSLSYREDSLQQKYGTPANLPKKPPPSQFLSHYTGDNNAIQTTVATVSTSNGANHSNVKSAKGT